MGCPGHLAKALTTLLADGCVPEEVLPAFTSNVARLLRLPGKGRTPEVLAEIRRIVDIWSECRGPFLFGGFTAADAMYAPVVLRFRTYEVALPPVCRDYADAVLGLPALQAWMRDAEAETEILPQFELYA